MKKSFILDEIDCPNCAAKFENAIKKVEGVNSAAVNFFAQKLIIDIDDERFDEVMKEVIAVGKRTNPDCKIK
ncbi:MAG: cation transporter [Clostridia bacterium]|nr:cation transporter [Clostridia bacterium]